METDVNSWNSLFKINQKRLKSHKESLKEISTLILNKLNTNNPKEFGIELNNLDPHKNTHIHMEVYNSEGNITKERQTLC